MTKQGFWLGGAIGGLLLALAMCSTAAAIQGFGADGRSDLVSESLRAVPSHRVQSSADSAQPKRRLASQRRGGLDPRSRPSTREAALEGGRTVTRRITLFKGAVALATLALLVVGQRLDRRARGGQWSKARRAGLLLLAVVAFASSYNFFRWRHYDGIHAHEVFHYYLGAKYFSELGYFDLYECTVVALAEARPALVGDRAPSDPRPA